MMQFGVQLDNSKYKERSDGVLTCGLRHSTTSGHLQWLPEGSTDRLPGGGGTTSGCPSSCHLNCANESEDSLITVCDLPAPSRAKRPLCVVFDESDPISALERSFEISAESQSQSKFTQTIFVEHKSTQTENANRFTKVQSESTQVEDSKHKSTQTENDNRFTKVRNETTQVDEVDFHLTNEPRKKKNQKKPSIVVENPSYYISNRKRTKSFSAPFVPKHSNILQRMHLIRRNFSEDKQIETEVQTNQEKEEIPKSCSNCRNMPDISRKLSELMLKFDRQEAQVRQLENALNLLRLQQEIINSNPPVQAAQSIARMRDDSTITDQSDIRNSNQSSPASQGVMRIRDASTITDPSFKFTPTKSRVSHREEVNVILGNSSSKVEFAVQSTPNYLWQSQHTDECQLCSEKLQPVLDDLIDEVLRLMGHRDFSDIMLTVLLRSDNVYHVNVQERESKRNLGCILVTHTAIERAAKSGFFNQVLTYSVTDVRNTFKSTSSRPFGTPFEFVSTEDTAVNSTNDDQDNFRVCEFLTKVLRMPAIHFNPE